MTPHHFARLVIGATTTRRMTWWAVRRIFEGQKPSLVMRRSLACTIGFAGAEMTVDGGYLRFHGRSISDQVELFGVLVELSAKAPHLLPEVQA